MEVLDRVGRSRSGLRARLGVGPSHRRPERGWPHPAPVPTSDRDPRVAIPVAWRREISPVGWIGPDPRTTAGTPPRPDPPRSPPYTTTRPIPGRVSTFYRR